LPINDWTLEPFFAENDRNDGQYLPQAAWRSNAPRLLQGSAPVFWGADKS